MNPNPPAPSANPGQAAGLAPFDLARPWMDLGYPEALLPLLFPPDPWALAGASGVLFVADPDLQAASQNPDSRRRSFWLDRVRELLGQRLYSAHSGGWAALSSAIRAMPGPSLQDHLLHLLPPQTAPVLVDLWSLYQRELLRELWDQVPEDPRQDWRVTSLYPPFRAPDPAPVPPPPVEPAPDLWLAWAHPSQGSLAPMLLRAVTAPQPLDALELIHTSGWTQAPTTVECPVALDQPEADPIIRCLHHRQRGIWVDAARGSA